MPQEQMTARTGSSGQGAQARNQDRFAQRDSFAETASEMWDSAYEQGMRTYRQGSQALGNLDQASLAGLLVAGALGFGLAWLLFGHRTDDVARRMSRSSDRYGPDYRHRDRSR
jgi:hypothetical protein